MGLLTKFAAVISAVTLATSGLITQKQNTYYFDSVNGKDSNKGTSVSAPFQSLDKLNALILKEGDKIYIKAGSEYRGALNCKSGVTYSSYGEGEKPTFMPSINASSKDKWAATKYENVWKFKTLMIKDAGNIIFNQGEICGIKIADEIKGYEGLVSELKNDLEFVHYNGYVYLYSATNPALRFSSIEIAYYIDGINLADGVTLDGIRVLYAGAHGMQAKNEDNITINNCEVGFCGGSLHKNGSRYGNGIEFWNGGTNLTVTNCYVHDIYDAGLTFQGDSGSFINVNFSNNKVENCTYSIEYFLHGDGVMKNILIDSNNLLNAGTGWGRQRSDIWYTAHFNTWNHIENRCENFVISNNTLKNSRFALFNIASTVGTLPTFSNNTYMQPSNDGQCFRLVEIINENFYSGFDHCYQDSAKEWLANNDPTGQIIVY